MLRRHCSATLLEGTAEERCRCRAAYLGDVQELVELVNAHEDLLVQRDTHGNTVWPSPPAGRGGLGNGRGGHLVRDSAVGLWWSWWQGTAAGPLRCPQGSRCRFLLA